MFNEPSSGERRPHPLDRPPQTPTPSVPRQPIAAPAPDKRHPLERPPGSNQPPPRPGEPPRQRITLQLPVARPTITYALIAINVAFFVIRALSFKLDTQIFDWGANNANSVLRAHEYYRLLTSMFLHAGIYSERGTYALANAMHLIFNMFILYQVGIQLERIFGHARFLTIYLLGGLTASVASIVINGPDVVSVGASGAVFAILAAEFVYLFQHRQILGGFATRQMRSLVMLAIINFAIGFATSLYGTSMRVDNSAHFGGLIGGLVLTFLIGPIYRAQPNPQNPMVMVGVDTNPLRNRLGLVAVFFAVLVAILVGAGRR